MGAYCHQRRRFNWPGATALVTVAAVIVFVVVGKTPVQALSQAAVALKPSKAEGTPSQDVALPASLTADQVDDFMAALSDEQVRRLLIEALKKQAAAEAAATAPAEEVGGLAGVIQKSKELMEKLRERIAFLQSGAAAAPAQVPTIFTYLGTGEKTSRPAQTIISVALLFAAAAGVLAAFLVLTAGPRKRLAAGSSAKLTSRLGASLGLALLSIAAMGVFAAAVLAFFYGFMERTTPQSVLVATYLVAILIVWTVSLVSRFLLAPRRPNLRPLPVSDETAVYVHRWVVAIAAVGSFGLLTCGIIRLAGASEAVHFQSVTLVGIVMAAMLVWMIVQKRKDVSAVLVEGPPENSLRYRLARRWHIYAILGVVVLLALTVVNGLLTESPRYLGVKTLLIVPLYLLLDWGLRQILDVGFGLARKPQDLAGIMHTAGIGEETERVASQDSLVPPVDGEHEALSRMSTRQAGRDEEVGIAAETTTADAGDGAAEKQDDFSRYVNLQRTQRVIRTGLRAALAAWMVLWVLSVWGVNLPIGEKVTAATFNILVVVIMGYIAWEVISAAIQRRIRQEMPDEDEDREEGGAGGSRVGTLLLILRKFILVVIIIMVALITLSSIGVDIAPLIAGAGVVGLAIGFGAQTLVKDIISGMFFLIDDAFRVGDYVNCGSQKGTVEHISLRSLRLRHPRGMVYTIPFGDISSVTNFSRDYIITKLDFRVPFDTDVEAVRKIVKKKVYKEIMKDPELASKLLAPIKSQGVREMDDDSALIVRVKYKTPPGEQFVIRKQVYRLMQQAFQEAGLRFAPRNVTVSLPPEVQQSLAHADAETRGKVLEASIAAAGEAAQAEERQKQQAAKK
jgi:small-conductance mechanosensitive channel